MAVDVICVDSMGEYYDKIAEIGKKVSQKKQGDEIYKKPATLWFRAESRIQYTLIPSLFRDNQGINGQIPNEQYSNMHYAEDIRVQHYNAKNYHYLDKEPSSRIEWLEVMQHHGVKTRVLDWSESSTHSLLFALEPFYSQRSYEDKTTLTPCVWVLEPQDMNKELFVDLGQKVNLQKKLLSDLGIGHREKKKILDRIAYLTDAENMRKHMEQNSTYHIDYLLNLSAINDEMNRDSNRLGKMLANGEAINPLFYLLKRIYSDGCILEDYQLPPLAVTHPYHSERIRTQKGVFTVWPFYNVLSEKQREHLRFLNINPDSMSFNQNAQKHLHKIILCKPQKMAHEILTSGMNESWLYPEMPIVSGEIEHRGVG